MPIPKEILVPTGALEVPHAHADDEMELQVFDLDMLLSSAEQEEQDELEILAALNEKSLYSASQTSNNHKHSANKNSPSHRRC